MGGDKKPRLAILVTHPIQHFAPLYKKLAQNDRLKVKVFFYCHMGINSYFDPGFREKFSWDIPLLEGYEYAFLPIKQEPRELKPLAPFSPGLLKALQAYDPDYVYLTGYAYLNNWLAFLWSRYHRKKLLFFSDSELLHSRTAGAKLFKRIVLPWFYRGIDAFVTIGDHNELYYKHYGVPGEKLVRGAYPVDITRFASVKESLTADSKQELRAKWSLYPDSTVILFVGKFIEDKCPLDLIEALHGLDCDKHHIQALFIGSGPLLEEMKARISAYGLERRVIISGFVNQTEMPRCLAMGDVIAMCSQKDPHPCAVSEAMAAGNAVIASDKIGCIGASDTVRHGINALVYPCRNVTKLSEAILFMAQNHAERLRMANTSREIARTQDLSVTANAILKAMQIAGGHLS